MTLDEQLLQRLAKWRPDTSSDHLTVDDPASGWRADVRAAQIDTLGCRLHEVGVARLAPLTNPTPIADRAQRIAARVTGLLEPLRLVEADAGQGVAQLRSDAPAARGEKLAYYEVTVNQHGSASVGRYEATQGGGKRQAVPFTLTHEALGKLVRDLAVD